ncbi:MAG: hypothetical protein HKM04_01235 [Legionellales bacterium]|nr:hypothetical protein [Legionellales bacterium]
MTIAIRNFIRVGGDINSAKIRLFGRFERRVELRNNLKNCLSRHFFLNNVEEPVGHHVEHEDESLDYLFKKDALTFRKADMRKAAESYEDIYSQDLKNGANPNIEKIQKYQKLLDSEFDKFALENGETQGDIRMKFLIKNFGTDSMTSLRYGVLPEARKTELRRILEISIVNEEGSFPLEWIPSRISEKPSYAP